MDNSLLKTISYKLNSGLSIYVNRQTYNMNSTMVCLSIKAGSAYEKTGTFGLSHFLEHLSIDPYLYPCKEQQTIYFKAFDYAYTSFYETAYFFKAVDQTGELLNNSLMTARGILDGKFLHETAFLRTKKDVLNEHWDFSQKLWYPAYRTMLDTINMTLPIGDEKDILKFEYEDLRELCNKQYKMNHAAIIITSPHEMEIVSEMVKEAFDGEFIPEQMLSERRAKYNIYNNLKFEKQISDKAAHFKLIAWRSRSILPVLETLKKYVSFAVLARVIELSLTEKEEIESAECSVLIFNTDHYLFSLILYQKEDKLISDSIQNITHNRTLSKQLLKRAKAETAKQLEEQYEPNTDQISAGDIVDCCREHFLFEEPIIQLENEYEICLEYLQNISYSEIKQEFDLIMKQFTRIL